MAAELFGFTREMTGHFMNIVEHIQTQMNQILAQAEAQRAEAGQREEAQRAEALKWDENNSAREQVLIQMKTTPDQTNADRKKAQIEANQKRDQALLKMKAEADEATRKREQLFMEHELKRQKMLVEANTSLQQEKLKMDMNRETAILEAMERREVEFQQRGRAADAQQKLRQLAAQELKELST